MTDKIVMYCIYLAMSIGLTIWVGSMLSRSGRIFLADTFVDERLAGSVNHLLVIGFYLLNLGYVSVTMREGGAVADAATVMEKLSAKVGLVLLVLGAAHFFNLFVLNRYRQNRLHRTGGLPAAPRPLTPAELAWAQWAQHQAQAYSTAQAHSTAQAPRPAQPGAASGTGNA